MQPQILKLGVLLGLLVFCLSSEFVTAEADLRSNNIWQNGPINCYTCDSIDECDQSAGVLRKCENNDAQTCLTVFNSDGVVSQRGCSDIIASSSSSSYCASNPENCRSCISSGCNVATTLSEYHECLACDSVLDSNCVFHPSEVTTKQMCLGGCMTALYATDESSHRYYLVRSCLNDRDLDERDACLDGSDSKCTGCLDSNCNTHALPETRNYCYHCDGEDCEDLGQEQECIVFNDDKEQCYIRFDEKENNVIAMGCISDFANDEAVVALVKQKALFICDGDKCNSFSNIPQSNQCTACDSVTNVNCAIKPSTVKVQKTCRIVPYTSCYERVNAGVTERGCLSDLPGGDDFYNCLTSADKNCKTCTGAECNEEIIPADRRKCHRCDSQTDAKCHSSPAALSICPTYDQDDSCVALFENGITLRGCRTEFSCNANLNNCEICNEDGCNVVNIKKRSEEIYGAFQELPLKCNTCSDDCETYSLNTCEGDIYQDCMAVFNESGIVVGRGCETLIEPEYEEHCASHPELCFNCKSNGCNSVNDATKFQECLYCNTAENPDCLLNPSAVTTHRKCVEGCVSSLYPRKTHPGVYDFVRTCFEDIEIDDREKCTAENNCVKCNDSNDCNVDILPEEGRLSCLHCSGDDCDLPESKECIGFSENDECYMFFDNSTFSAVRMGCKSELTEAEILADVKQYFLCDGENCNDYKNLPDAKLCKVCDSATDENCAVQPSDVTGLSRCQIHPYTECYMRVREDGHTERGCLYNLPIDNFLACQNGETDACNVCAESYCNEVIYPTNRQKCYRCNSTVDDDCERAPTNTQACPLYKAEDNCVTKLIDGTTHRGCGSELSCDDSSQELCETCAGDNCNTVHLTTDDPDDIGDPGIFQDLPLNCYHCGVGDNFDDCLASSSGKLNVCEGNKLQTCTTVFSSDGNVTERGCSDDAKELCSVNGNTCFNCKSNGCNIAKEQSDYIDCIFCDGKKDDDCIFDVSSVNNVRKCYKSCMTALYPRTDDLAPVYELIRTCLDDMDLDDREECAAGNNERCKACSSASCNTDDVGERKSCYHCSGDNCQDPQISTCHAIMDHDQCFVEYDETGSVVEMGCKSKYDPDEVKTLVTAKRLWLCDDDNCNIQDKFPVTQRCKICNSRTDPNCAIAPDSVASSTTCANLPYTECYTRILENGHTERGCLSSIEGAEFYSCLNGFNAMECNACVGDNCNLNIYPENRLSCQVCNSDTTETCETSPQSAQVCLKYTPDEKCVSALNENGVTVRGCSSQEICDPKHPNKCQICDSDNCNSSNLKRKSDGKPGVWQPLPLSCHSCYDEEDCKTADRQLICTTTEYCMTVFGDNGAIVKRSCSNAIESEFGSYCDLNPGKCHNCNSNQCNSATSLSDYVECVYCDSETDSNCVHNPTAVGNRRACHTNCMTALYPRTNGSSLYELTRTCLDDKDLEDQQKCHAGDDNCIACNSGACNIATLPAERLSCYSCKGESCEDPQPKQCDVYSTVDQCYMLFDDQSDMIQMGCVSELDESFVEENIYQLFMCNDKDNCNDFENVPTPQTCASCASNVNTDCALSPANVPSIEHCTALPNTQCYTRVNSGDGSTDRGCVSSLSKSNMVSCLSGNSEACTTCLGDRCNIEIFPTDRRRCHRCNSLDDPTCESNPQAESACAVYSENESCSTKLVDSVTYRGCSSDFTCDTSDTQYCRMCAGADNCNVVDLTSGNIGYPGKWQGVPINCYTCIGEECTQGSGIIAKCENNDLQTCGTVFAVDGSIQQRGCSDQVYGGEFALFCNEYPSLCKFCKSNGCNTATSLEDYVDCLYCDAADNKDCIFNVETITHTRTCHQQCFTGLYPREQEANPVYDLARGCLDDLDLDDRENCANGNMKYCKACEGEKCNIDAIPEARGKCLVCNGEGCADPLSQECTAFRENYQCFTLFNSLNDIESMGCASDLDTAYIEANKRILLLCDGDDCNTFENIPTGTGCRVCNSIDEPGCAMDPANSAVAAACQDLPYTQCYTRVDKIGVTHRGCLADIKEDDVFNDCVGGNSDTCEICQINNCNSEVYPTDRRRCNRCSSANEPLCEDSPQEFSSICPIYNENDNCVSKVDGNYLMHGCTSEFTCDVSDRKSCHICETDNCNTANLLAAFIGEPGKWQELPLNCYVCDGEECTSDSGTIEKCEDNNLQNCVTVFGSDGAVEKRGCSDAIAATHDDYCYDNPEKCIGCKSNSCNNATSLSDFIDCYFCDSASSSTCSLNFDSATKTRKCQNSCMVALYPRTSSNDPAYEMSRSCLDDMDIDEREACVAGELEFCRACDSDRCNTASVPDERHECYKCVGDSCEDIATHACNAHHPNDQCYILFDKESSISGMGCRSEFEMDVVTELIKQKAMILCNGKNCNDFQKVPTPQTCSVCNSESNPLCATNPNVVENPQRCSTLPYTDCFTRVNAGGQTERGCLSSLESETFYGCLMKTDGLCETCTGDKCNEIDVFPADRWKCHQCSSETDPLCSSTPNNNNICPVYSQTDSCVTNLRNGITTRGCSSNMKCDNPSDKRTCRVCNTQGCNTANLEKVSDSGEPGKWQDIPITCRTCKGEEDCEGGSIFRVCENNPYQNCMTVFNADGKVSQRGCSDTVEADNEAYCADNTGKCLACNSNGCNMPTSLDDYVECLACDTDTNGDCLNDVTTITKTRQCYKHCMTALYPREEEANPAYGLSRSCYDDMDLDDRDSCAAGEKEYCQICSEAKCNTVTMPEEKRLSCNQCVDDDCQDPQAMTCLAYRPDDKCYVRYDEQRSIIAMGCRSEFSNADADYLLKQKRLFLCEGDNCNTIEALPAAQTCIICSSRTDVSCAISPESVNSRTTCAISPFTECYSRVLSNGATERGCLSSLYDDEFLGCLDGSSTTCKSCKGDSCNNQVHPEDRAQCHICDSLADPNCESSPSSLSICPKYDVEETCVTKFLNDVTYRGCSSSIECDGSNPRACNKCTGNGCNTINLAKHQDDNFGKWQDLPLSCLTCSGNDCNSESTTETLTCQNNNEQDCMIIFDVSGKVERRGCSDVVNTEYHSYCDANEGNCFNCKSNKCNTATAKSEFVDCVYCDSYKDLTCITNPLSDTHKIRQCQGGCMTALYPFDGSSDPAYELTRTCLNDKETADQTRCSDSSDANCKACTGAKCNVEGLPEDRLSCISCEGENCEEPTSQLCPLHKPNDKCYVSFDQENSVIEMGCLSSGGNHDLESLIKTKRIYFCDGVDCNTLDKLPQPQKCAACSSVDDVFCATNANEIGNFNDCNQMPYTSCYTKVTNDGSTQRGCLSELPGDDFADCLLGRDENCDVCSGDACNREIFPADRQQCHTCTSEDDPKCESFPEQKMPCPIVGSSETCISALSGNVTIRGCSSEVHCDSTITSTCRSCIGTSCNSIDLANKVDDGHGVWQDLPLRCHTCEGEHCLNSLGAAVTCANNDKQDCMTVFTADGQVKRRGCSDAVEDYEDLNCRLNPSLCFKCKSNECNIAWSVGEYIQCSFCNSETDPLCAINAEKTNFPKRSCYKECLVAMKGQEVLRSCLDDKELYSQHECQTGFTDKVCASCDTTNCNIFQFPIDRLTCHHCTNAACSRTESQYCRIYDENDFCFAKYENNNVELMGCGSAQSKNDIESWETQNKLYTCQRNECNALPNLPTSGICLSCDSSKTPSCAQSPFGIKVEETCNALRKGCITRTNTAGHTLRGCVSSLEESEVSSCTTSGTCVTCQNDRCNSDVFPDNRRRCHICNSVADENCAKSPNSPLVCLKYDSADVCVAKYTDGYVERGCSSDITCDANDKDNCQVCGENNCNTAQLTGSAGMISSSFMLTCILAFAAILILKDH